MTGFSVQSKIAEYIRRPIFWFYLVLLWTTIIFCFLSLIGLSNYLYGILIGSGVVISINLVSIFMDKKILNNEKVKMSQMQLYLFLSWIFKIAVFVGTIIPIVITNMNTGDGKWESFNTPIASIMLIIIYGVYSVVYLIDLAFVNSGDDEINVLETKEEKPIKKSRKEIEKDLTTKIHNEFGTKRFTKKEIQEMVDEQLKNNN